MSNKIIEVDNKLPTLTKDQALNLIESCFIDDKIIGVVTPVNDLFKGYTPEMRLYREIKVTNVNRSVDGKISITGEVTHCEVATSTETPHLKAKKINVMIPFKYGIVSMFTSDKELPVGEKFLIEVNMPEIEEKEIIQLFEKNNQELLGEKDDTTKD